MAGRFPVSDHCDGGRFFNPSGWRQAPPFTALPRWWWQRLVLRQGEWWPSSVPPGPKPALPAAVGPRGLAATFVGHATFLLQLPGLTALTDPFFSRRTSPWQWCGPKRVRPPALALAELPPVDLVLLSHNHYDHLDLPALRWLARHRRPVIVTTLGNKAWLEARGVDRVVELDWWRAHDLPRAKITLTPAQHFSARWPWDRNRTLWGGLLLETAKWRILFAGDTGYAPHFGEIRRRLGAPDLALLPIGAYEPRWFMRAVHLNPEEAAQAHLDLGARASLGMHFGTVQLTNEGIDAPLRDLAAARRALGVAEAAFSTPAFGETRLFEN